MEWLDYRQIPPSAGGYSELFFDYLYDFASVRSYFPGDFREDSSYEALFKSIDARLTDRATLVEVLKEQNAAFRATSRAFDNIALLTKPSTYAVVTGQQVGLFGGPLYTVYKTVTAIKLAHKLKLRFPRRDFVPVFWIEGEDHDFSEMNHAMVLDQENTLVQASYLPGGVMPERNVGAVGEMLFDATVAQTQQTLENALGRSEYTSAVIDLLKECYRPGNSFNGAFAEWMNHLFADHGLVFISSNHPRLKSILSPLFVKELEEFPKISQLVITQSAELERKYHAQVKPKSINLFLFHKGGRYLIEPRETDFSLKGTRAFFQKEELLAIARNTPSQLSPNVVLRPICQDLLLPTVAYVAGPSEVAYHAQIQPVYEAVGVPQPVVYPRASVSLIQANLVRAMEKYGLEISEFLGDIDRVTEKVLEQIAEIKLDRLFNNVTRNVHDALSEAKFGLNEVDPTLLGAFENMSAKIDVNIGVLREKAVAAQKRRNETAVRQIERAAAGLLPGGLLQERQLNVVYFMNKYGPDLIKWLMEQIDITGFKHQVITP
ncbi:MAG: bacillithiol biosynthesis cysteine-adding enzyme BshC [Bacteroidota bacterium]